MLMISEKNILLISKSSQPGGLEFHILELVKIFSPSNNVYVFVPEGPLVEEYAKAGAQVNILHPKSPFDFDYVAKVENFCRDNRIHVVHTNELICGQALFGALMAKVPKRIYHVHTPFLLWKYSNIFKKIVKTPINWLANFFYANFLATDVICLTPMIKKHRILFEWVLPFKLKVIPNAIDLERFSKVPSYEELAQMKRKLGIPQDKVVIGNVSRLTREKGHMVLIKAFQELDKEFPDKYHLLIAGGGELEQQYSDYCEYYLTGRYSFTGKFAEEDKVKIIHTINYAVFPSFAEGFGYVLTEFMASKIPVIASNLPVLKYVGGLGVWYFHKGSVKDLFTRLKEVTSLSDSMINDKLKLAYVKLNEYSITSFAKNYSTVYGE